MMESKILLQSISKDESGESSFTLYENGDLILKAASFEEPESTNK